LAKADNLHLARHIWRATPPFPLRIFLD
jgi:hypothetical protein